MPSSKNSPTDGEIAAGTVATGGDATPTGATAGTAAPESSAQPVVSDGEVSAARVEETQKPAEFADVADDQARQYPEPTPEEQGVEDEPALLEAAEEAEAEPGEVWAKYKGSSVHSRGLTLEDQRRLGVPEDKLVDNSADASPQGMVGQPLEPGLWWTKENRHRVNVTGYAPALVMYLDEDDDQFEVTRY